MLPHEEMERWMAERLFRHFRPRIYALMEEFLNSEDGKQIMAEAFSDILVDGFLVAPSSDNVPSWLEETLLRVVVRMAKQPGFRGRLVKSLGAEAFQVPEP